MPCTFEERELRTAPLRVQWQRQRSERRVRPEGRVGRKVEIREGAREWLEEAQEGAPWVKRSASDEATSTDPRAPCV